jgi:hypothetical protein
MIVAGNRVTRFINLMVFFANPPLEKISEIDNDQAIRKILASKLKEWLVRSCRADKAPHAASRLRCKRDSRRQMVPIAVTFGQMKTLYIFQFSCGVQNIFKRP